MTTGSSPEPLDETLVAGSPTGSPLSLKNDFLEPTNSPFALLRPHSRFHSKYLSITKRPARTPAPSKVQFSDVLNQSNASSMAQLVTSKSMKSKLSSSGRKKRGGPLSLLTEEGVPLSQEQRLLRTLEQREEALQEAKGRRRGEALADLREIRLELADYYAAREKFDNAVSHYRMALKLLKKEFSTNSGVGVEVCRCYYNLSQCLFNGGDVEESQAVIRKGIEINENNSIDKVELIQAKMQLAHILRRTGQHEESDRELRHTMEIARLNRLTNANPGITALFDIEKIRESAVRSFRMVSPRMLEEQDADDVIVAPASEYYLDNGDVYEGEWKDSFQCVKGRYEWASGDVYEGEFQNGVFNGIGTYTWVNGDTYTGGWKNGKQHGFGKFVRSTGERYEGVYNEDRREGTGSAVLKNGDSYTGHWKNDCFHGRGVFRSLSGDLYDGMFVEGVAEGHGVKRYASGDRYEGNWKNDEPYGHGTMYFDNGDIYKGEFRGVPCHEGTMEYASGDVYSGQWRGGKPHGRGLYTYANLDTYDGEWVYGRQQGYGTYTWASSNNSFTGYWKKHRPHGPGKRIFSNGTTEEGVFDMGILIGRGRKILRQWQLKEQRLLEGRDVEDGDGTLRVSVPLGGSVSVSSPTSPSKLSGRRMPGINVKVKLPGTPEQPSKGIPSLPAAKRKVSVSGPAQQTRQTVSPLDKTAIASSH
eukprot:Rmarinus@m.10872